MIDFYLKGLVGAVLLGALAGVITAIVSGKVQVAWIVAVVLVVFIVTLIAGFIRRVQTTYTITNQRLTIHTGILSKELHETRLERVQNVNSNQSLIQRILQIGTVTFDTAGEAGFNFKFQGVSGPNDIVRTVDHAIREFQARQPGV
jgi:uncharacterized membrane protein YdbT with pleckstrin-like domain